MKKEEKTKQTCEKIVHAATIEFGSRSYDAVSLNAICGKYQIAKGLIYHNFKNKDELYGRRERRGKNSKGRNPYFFGETGSVFC